jgi:hypothetical protein
LTFSHNKFRREILLPDLSGFFLNPAVKPDLPDAAEIEQLEIVGVLSGLVSDWRQQ